MNSTLKNRITRLAAAGALAVTGVQVAPAVVAPVAAHAEVQPGPGPIDTVNQNNTGLPTAASDCGPSSMVVALNRFGQTPRGWDQGKVAAVQQARVDSGDPSGYLNAPELENILNLPDYDVTYYTQRNNLALAKERVKKGTPDPSVVLGTNDVGAHWVALVGYDNGAYVVVDPNGGRIEHWSDADLNWFADQGRLGSDNPQMTITLTHDPR